MDELLFIANNIKIPLKDRNDIIEYIEHNEYGIALEILCSTIQQEKIEISLEQYEIIKKIGLYMKLDEELWNNIKIRSNI